MTSFIVHSFDRSHMKIFPVECSVSFNFEESVGPRPATGARFIRKRPVFLLGSVRSRSPGAMAQGGRPQVASPSILPHPRLPLLRQSGGHVLPRFSTTSTFRPMQTPNGASGDFRVNQIFIVFGIWSVFVQRGGVFSAKKTVVVFLGENAPRRKKFSLL